MVEKQQKLKKTFFEKFPIKGSIINGFAVSLGAFIGVIFGRYLMVSMKSIALNALGFVSIGMGLKMFSTYKNILSVGLSLILGAMIGKILHIDSFMHYAAISVANFFHADGNFAEVFLFATVFCTFGPMTFMGVGQEVLRGKIDILLMKSLINGIWALFYATMKGVGVIASGAGIFVVQFFGVLILLLIKPILKNKIPIQDIAGIGGLILTALGLKLLGFKQFQIECFIFGFFLIPLFSKILSFIVPNPSS